MIETNLSTLCNVILELAANDIESYASISQELTISLDELGIQIDQNLFHDALISLSQRKLLKLYVYNQQQQDFICISIEELPDSLQNLWFKAI